MNDILRIARLKIALQRAFLGRAILIFTLQGWLAYIGANTTYRLPIFEAKTRVQKQLQMQIPHANCPPTFWRKFKVQIPPNTFFGVQLR